MIHSHFYNSPIGKMLLSCDDIGLCGIWFCGQKYYPTEYEKHIYIGKNQIIEIAKKWLDSYFHHEIPTGTPPLHIFGTEFQKIVWNELLNIPYGTTSTYGEIANAIAKKRNVPKMSAQAVGFAISRNPISIIIPCHRVIGKDGSLVGYAGGLDKKRKLLQLEKAL